MGRESRCWWSRVVGESGGRTRGWPRGHSGGVWRPLIGESSFGSTMCGVQCQCASVASSTTWTPCPVSRLPSAPSPPSLSLAPRGQPLLLNFSTHGVVPPQIRISLAHGGLVCPGTLGHPHVPVALSLGTTESAPPANVAKRPDARLPPVPSVETSEPPSRKIWLATVACRTCKVAKLAERDVDGLTPVIVYYYLREQRGGDTNIFLKPLGTLNRLLRMFEAHE